jgi:sortase A
MRRSLRALSSVLIIAGVLLIADAVVTVLWQEPVSAGYASLRQRTLRKDLDRLVTSPPDAVVRRALGRVGHDSGRRVAVLARAFRRRVRAGQAIGRIRFPRIGGSWVAVQGTDGPDLRKGPGHYTDTPLPGLHGTVAIAGHRTTYLAPFRHVDDLRRGDRVVVEMPYGVFTYAVEKTKIVSPSAVSVKRPVGHDQLVLTACHPLYSAAKRIVVFARLRGVEPRGAART